MTNITKNKMFILEIKASGKKKKKVKNTHTHIDINTHSQNL